MVSGGNTSSRAAPRAPRPVPGLVRETCFHLASPSLSFLICKLTPRGCDGVARASHSVYRPCCWWLEFKPLAGGVEAPFADSAGKGVLLPAPRRQTADSGKATLPRLEENRLGFFSFFFFFKSIWVWFRPGFGPSRAVCFSSRLRGLRSWPGTSSSKGFRTRRVPAPGAPGGEAGLRGWRGPPPKGLAAE